VNAIKRDKRVAAEVKFPETKEDQDSMVVETDLVEETAVANNMDKVEAVVLELVKRELANGDL